MNCALVLAGAELVFITGAGTQLCFGFFAENSVKIQ